MQIYSSSVPVPKLIKPNWPNSSVNTGVVNMLPVFHLEKCFFLSGGFIVREKAVMMKDGSFEL